MRPDTLARIRILRIRTYYTYSDVLYVFTHIFCIHTFFFYAFTHILHTRMYFTRWVGPSGPVSRPPVSVWQDTPWLMIDGFTIFHKGGKVLWSERGTVSSGGEAGCAIPRFPSERAGAGRHWVGRNFEATWVEMGEVWCWAYPTPGPPPSWMFALPPFMLALLTNLRTNLLI